MERKKLNSGHEVVLFPKDDEHQIKKDFESYKEGVVQLKPGKWFFPRPFLQYADRLYNYEFRSEDVLVMTYPKCGTRWMLELVWTMRNNPDINHPDAHLSPIFRTPYLEFDFIKELSTIQKVDQDAMERFHKLCPEKDPKDGIYLQMSQVLPEPRTLKTHLPFSLMPPNLLDTCKVIYLVRNPKDVLVSYHHHSLLLNVIQYVGSFENFLDYFLRDELMYGSFWEHLKEAWGRRSHPNLHFAFYEDLKKNPQEEIRKLSEFLDIKLHQTQIEKIVEFTKFESVKKRAEEAEKKASKEQLQSLFRIDLLKTIGGQLRKGQVGSYKETLSFKQEAKLNDWINKNLQTFEEEFKSPWHIVNN